MAIAVAHAGGGPGAPAANGTDTTSPSWTSVAGSLICGLGVSFGLSGAEVGANWSDSKSNGYTLLQSQVPDAAAGLGSAYNNGGTRGSSHTVSYNGTGTGEFNTEADIEITGHDVASPFDATTQAVSSQTFTVNWTISTAAAVRTFSRSSARTAVLAATIGAVRAFPQTAVPRA